MTQEFRRFEPPSDFFTFQTVGESIEGRPLAPRTLNNAKGEPRPRHIIQFINGKIKILPDHVDLNGRLDGVLQKHGAGCAWVKITWKGTRPTKKGNSQYIYEVFGKTYENEIETAANGPDLSE